MCGIAGMVDWRAATSADALRSIADAMIETVRHRVDALAIEQL